jgi:aspartyl-tRNA(Asn)/glutamyl-tRNA(Gln) amidotransferase subunit A
MCGITAIKPTYGRVSRYGMIAFASSLDQGGPMARRAEDCAILLDAMAGFDERDSTCLSAESAQRPILAEFTSRCASQAGTTAPLRGVRIGVPREFFGEGLSADVGEKVEAALAEFERLGAVRVDISLPRTRLSIPAYYVIAPAEASSNLSRFDGMRFGHRARDYRDLTEMIERSRAEGFGAEPKRRIFIGAYVLSHGYYDAYYLQAQRVRRLIGQDFQQAFKSCDVIMGPVAPTTAWNLGAKSSDPVAMYLEDIYTLGVSLAGLPGMSVPCGFGRDGMPVGLQIIGNYFDEGRMLALAHRYQLATDWHLRTPEAFK